MKTRNTIWIASVLAFVILGLCGCASTAGIDATGKKTWNQDGAPGLDTKVVINNSSLARNIEIDAIDSAMAGNMMRAQVSLHSKDRDTVSIQYRFAWFDIQGIEINPNAGAWKPFLLYGREKRTIQGLAPDPRAKEFKISIREPQG